MPPTNNQSINPLLCNRLKNGGITDTKALAKFISDFPETSGFILSDAIDIAVRVESARLLKIYDTTLEQEKSDPMQLKERLARQLYNEANQEKDKNNMELFAIKFKTITSSPLFQQTQAAFDLQRDEAMRNFFDSKFNSLIDSNRVIAAESISSIANKLTELQASVSSAIHESTPKPMSEAEEYNANRRFMLQQYYFDREMKVIK